MIMGGIVALAHFNALYVQVHAFNKEKMKKLLFSNLKFINRDFF